MSQKFFQNRTEFYTANLKKVSGSWKINAHNVTSLGGGGVRRDLGREMSRVVYVGNLIAYTSVYIIEYNKKKFTSPFSKLKELWPVKQ